MMARRTMPTRCSISRSCSSETISTRRPRSTGGLRNASAPVGVMTSFVLVECAGRSRRRAMESKMAVRMKMFSRIAVYSTVLSALAFLGMILWIAHKMP